MVTLDVNLKQHRLESHAECEYDVSLRSKLRSSLGAIVASCRGTHNTLLNQLHNLGERIC